LRGCFRIAQQDTPLNARVPIKRAEIEMRELSAIAAFCGGGARNQRAIYNGTII
jgi:hypothetical protein